MAMALKPAVKAPQSSARLVRLACLQLARKNDGQAVEILAGLGAIAPEEFWAQGEWEAPPGGENLLAGLSRAIESFPDCAWLYLLRSLSYRGLLLYQEALQDMESAVLLHESPVLLAFLGRARLLFRDQAGLASLEEAARKAPGCGWIRAWLGEARRILGDGTGALMELEEAVRLDSRYARALAWRGSLYRKAGRLDESWRDLSLALERDENYPWAFYERFLTVRALSRLSTDFSDLKRAVAGDPRYSFVEFPASPELIRRALVELSAIIVSHPRSVWAHAWRGEVRLQARDFVRASADLDRALVLDPECAWAYAWRGEARRCSGDMRGAYGDLSRAAVLDPSYPKAFAWRGRMLHEWGKYAAALRDYDRALELDPRCAWALAQRGEVKLALSRRKQAAEDFEKALALNPGYRDALRLLAMARGVST